ncbi:MAG: HAD-IIB family hydrolase [Rhizobiaceae bacterium]|nr:HAD-IIB family hydrolase [Rhizobiaceae bacterium]
MADNQLYVMHISIHGLLRATNPEVGTDIDTGGQVRYVLDLVEAMDAHPSIRKVDLLTRKIADARISPDYARDTEMLSPKVTIRRIPCGPARYIRKELLWPHLTEFVDGALTMIREQAELPDVLHAHYADAGLVAVRLSKVLGIPVVFTGHSLGRFKLANLMARGMKRGKANEAFALDARIEAEEETIENAALLVASSKNEEHEQYKLYDHFDPNRIMVNPPGCDIEKFGAEPKKPAVRELNHTLGRFLNDPDKPALIMLARPDPQKNILAAIETFAAEELRELCNLVLFLGARDDIREFEAPQRKLLQEVLYLVDRHDLYGSIAYPKRNPPEVAAALFHYASKTGGALLGLSRHENFGLTLVEAAAAGLPVVTSGAGGMSDIVEICNNGIFVNPDRFGETARRIRKLVTDRSRWNRMAKSGKVASRAKLSWKSHLDRYLPAVREIVKAQATPVVRSAQPKPLSKITKLLICDIDDTLTGNRRAVHRFNRFVEERDDITFGISTGRNLSDAMETLKSWSVIEPQFLITSVGTEIHTNFGNLVPNSMWNRHLKFRWKPQDVREVLAKLSQLRPQEDEAQSHYKISYYCEGAGASTAAEIKSVLRKNKLQARVIVSRNYCVDVVPVRASKGHALRFLAAQWNIDLGSIFTAGDSGNDLDMLSGLVKATVVGNHSGELEALREDSNTYFSTLHSAAGILDGLAHYGLIAAQPAQMPSSK